MLQLLTSVIENNKSDQWYSIIFHRNRELFNWILAQTIFIDQDIEHKHSINQRIYHIINQTSYIPKCYCGKFTN
jgi:hypothetical protein